MVLYIIIGLICVFFGGWLNAKNEWCDDVFLQSLFALVTMCFWPLAILIVILHGIILLGAKAANRKKKVK